jgi:hypothetical protein
MNNRLDIKFVKFKMIKKKTNVYIPLLSFSVTHAHSEQLFSFVCLFVFFYILVDITNGNDRSVIKFHYECVLCAVIRDNY